MGILAGISGKEAIRKFCSFGYTIVRQRGSHVRLHHPLSTRHFPLTIPLHRELKIGLLRQLIRDAGLDVQEFFDL